MKKARTFATAFIATISGIAGAFTLTGWACIKTGKLVSWAAEWGRELTTPADEREMP